MSDHSGSQVRGVVTKPDAFDRTWRKATDAANALHAKHDFEGADRLYGQAYHEARMRFAEAWNGMDYLAPHAVPMMVISASNAARNCLKRGQSRLAADQLISALDIFQRALSSRRADLALKQACIQHLPRLISIAVSSGIDTEHDRLVSAASEARTLVLNGLKATTH